MAELQPLTEFLTGQEALVVVTLIRVDDRGQALVQIRDRHTDGEDRVQQANWMPLSAVLTVQQPPASPKPKRKSPFAPESPSVTRESRRPTNYRSWQGDIRVHDSSDPAYDQWHSQVVYGMCGTCHRPLDTALRTPDVVFGWCREHGSWIYNRGDNSIENTRPNPA